MIIKIEGKQGCGKSVVAALVKKMLKDANWTYDLNGDKIVIRDGADSSVDAVVGPGCWTPQAGDIVRRITGSRRDEQTLKFTDGRFYIDDGGTFTLEHIHNWLEFVRRPASVPVPVEPWVPQAGDIVRRREHNNPAEQVLQNCVNTDGFVLQVEDGGRFTKSSAAAFLEFVRRPAPAPVPAPGEPRYVLRSHSDRTYFERIATERGGIALWGHRRKAKEMTKSEAAETAKTRMGDRDWREYIALVRVRGT